jgi:hypothetical protein
MKEAPMFMLRTTHEAALRFALEGQDDERVKEINKIIVDYNKLSRQYDLMSDKLYAAEAKAAEAMEIVADEFDKRAAMAHQIAAKYMMTNEWPLAATIWTEAAIVLRKAITEELNK